MLIKGAFCGRSNQRGASIIETVTAIVITGVIAAWAFPAYNNSVSNKELLGTRNELVTLLHTARSEAVLKRTNVTVCPRAGQSTSECDNSKQWHKGLLIFYDREGEGVLEKESRLIIATDPMYTENRIFFGHSKVTFNRNGFVVTQTGTFSICDDRADSYARGVVLSNTGNLVMAQDSDKDSDFIPEGKDGKNISCGIL